MALSQRHHYIPELLIKGFANKDGKVAVFDIKKNRLEPVRKSPKQVFFEWNRNTFEVHGEKTDFVEGLYQFNENQFAPVYKKIIQQNGPININAEDLFHLIFFIGFIHWRVPNKDHEAAKIIKKLSNKDLFFSIRNKDNNQEASSDLYKRIMNEPAFMESSKIILAVRDFLNSDMISNLKNWQIYYSPNKVQLQLLGDNPVIQRDMNDSNLFKTELIFPLSKGKTVYHTNGKTIKQLSPEHIVSVDILTFLQSQKMVCGPRGDYLSHIAQIACQYKDEKHIKNLKEDIFKIFE